MGRLTLPSLIVLSLVGCGGSHGSGSGGAGGHGGASGAGGTDGAGGSSGPGGVPDCTPWPGPVAKTTLAASATPPFITGITASGHVVVSYTSGGAHSGPGDIVAYPLAGGDPSLIEHDGTFVSLRNDYVLTKTTVWSAAGGSKALVLAPSTERVEDITEDGSAVLTTGNSHAGDTTPTQGWTISDVVLSVPATGTTMPFGTCTYAPGDFSNCAFRGLGRLFLQTESYITAPHEPTRDPVVYVRDPEGIITSGSALDFDSTQQRIVLRDDLAFMVAPSAGGDVSEVFLLSDDIKLLSNDDIVSVGRSTPYNLEVRHAAVDVDTGKPCPRITGVDPRNRYVLCSDFDGSNPRLVAISTALSDQALPMSYSVITDNGNGLITGSSSKRSWMRLDTHESGSVMGNVGITPAGDGLIVGGVQLMDVCANGALTPLFDPTVPADLFLPALSPDKRYLVYYDAEQKTLVSMQLR